MPAGLDRGRVVIGGRGEGAIVVWMLSPSSNAHQEDRGRHRRFSQSGVIGSSSLGCEHGHSVDDAGIRRPVWGQHSAGRLPRPRQNERRTSAERGQNEGRTRAERAPSLMSWSALVAKSTTCCCLGAGSALTTSISAPTQFFGRRECARVSMIVQEALAFSTPVRSRRQRACYRLDHVVTWATRGVCT